MIGNVLVHLRIIVSYTAEAEQWLAQSMESKINLKPLHQQYSAFYSHSQSARDDKLHWIELFATILLIGIFIALERLRRARAMLQVWNQNLQSQIERRPRELQTAREEADRVVEYAADPLLVLDLNRRIGRFNHAAAELIGGDPSSLLHRPIQELFHTSNSEGGDHEERWLQTDAGNQVPVLLSTSLLMGEGDNQLGEVWSLRDISQVKQLYADMHTYQQAIDRLLLLTVADTQGIITYANSNFLERTGYREEEVIGQNHSLLNSGYHTNEFWSEFWKAITSGEVWHGEICNQDKQGHKIWSDSSVSPMFNVNGEKSGYLAIRVDITEQVELRNERERQAYEGGIEEISSSILHNIGNTITGAEHQAIDIKQRMDALSRVVNYLQRLSQQQPLPDGESPRLQQLSETLGDFISHSGHTLQQQASTFSHIEGIIAAQRQVVQGGNWMSRFDLSEAVHEVEQLMQSILEKYQTALTVHLDQAPVAVTLPKSPFQQMLANLIKNSCESIGEQVLLGKIAQGQVTITITQSKSQNKFTVMVEDNGVGIPKQKQQEIFSRGVTSKESGTGQGLHSLALFIQRLSGEIKVESEGTGQGACFSITLPVDGESNE